MGSTMIMSLLSIKALIISAGIFVSLAMGITILSVHEIPVVWIWWLKPPYLHLITNAIIISIVASARFRQTQSESPPEHLITVRTPPPSYYGSLSIYTVVEGSTADESEDRVVELEPTAVNGSSVVIETKEVLDEAKHMIVDSVPAYNYSPWQEIISPDQPRLELPSPVEKPVLSPRLCHGNLIKTRPGEGTLTFLPVTGAKVSCSIPFPGAPKTPREPETLESIWKMITEKRQAEHVGTSLKGQNYYDLPESSRRTKYRRVFKDEMMRLQRQESLKSCKELLQA